MIGWNLNWLSGRDFMRNISPRTQTNLVKDVHLWTNLVAPVYAGENESGR